MWNPPRFGRLTGGRAMPVHRTAVHRTAVRCTAVPRTAVPRNAVPRTTAPRAAVPIAVLSVAALLLAALAVARPAAADPVTAAGPAAESVSPATPGATSAPADGTVAALRAEMEALRRDYEARMAELERRLDRLEAAPESTAGAATAPPAEAEAAPPAAATPSADDELAALRAAAASAAGPAETTPPVATAASEAAPGHERNLALLNPEISATGIFLGAASDADREQFDAREFELDVQSALDPFSRMRLTLAFGDGGVDVEEGWVRYASLPGGLDLLAGRFRQRFGALNRQHLHALPQVDYPLALRTYLGEEGLAQTGLSLSWLLPHPFASANELTLEVTDGDGEAFAGKDFQQLSLLGHAKSYWDLSDASYLEWGLSGVAGKGPLGGDRRIWGSDLTFNWTPPARAKYRDLTWRSEALLSQREDPLTGVTHDAWGGYTYLEGLVAANLSLGLRLDGVENPDDPDLFAWSVVPYVTWWQSEYVRLRGELRHTQDDALADPVNEVLLQLTWAAGPHKHETY